MNIALRWFGAVLLVGWMVPSSKLLAEPSATANGRARAEVAIPLRAKSIADLSFGSIVMEPSGSGTVEVAPDGAPARYANTTRSVCGGTAGCMPHRAGFEVSGEPNRAYRVTLPDQIMAYGVRTGAGLPIVALAMRSANAPSTENGGRLDNEGRDSFFVGGVLQVPGGTRPDVFHADIPVIVAYD